MKHHEKDRQIREVVGKLIELIHVYDRVLPAGANAQLRLIRAQLRRIAPGAVDVFINGERKTV